MNSVPWHGESLSEDPYLLPRRRMVEEQLRVRGLRDEAVLDAMMQVPREAFIPAASRHLAYDDRALAIEHGQTISQPYIVAYMTEKLLTTPSCRVLEVGTGTGYQAAVLASLVQHVYSIERLSDLKEKAAAVLAELGISNVSLFVGDGTLGLPEYAPFDRIIVTAGAPNVPRALVEQLVNGGVMVVPVGRENEQSLVRVTRRGDRAFEERMLGCRFVKLVGEEGWHISS
jgi:protein-L-isoaspartate(D-aspartate) O-methyltransferase